MNRNRRRSAITAAMALCLWCHAASAQTPRPIPSGNRVISGVVIGSSSGQPLEGADVTLNEVSSGALVAETETDAEGRFVFQHLGNGKFSLQASHRGYLASAFQEHEGFSTAIVTGEGLVSTDLRFPLEPQAVLYGTVADDSGDPVAQARVSLYRQNALNGTGNIVRSSVVMTDDLGNYEFPRLQPGNYYIGVSGHPWYASHPSPEQRGSSASDQPHSPLDVAYATTFYADVTDSDSATPIPVKAGDRIPVNFTLHAVPAVHITLEIPRTEPGRPGPLPSLRQEVFSSDDFVQGEMSFLQHSGGQSGDGMSSVEFGGVAPGQYSVELRSPRGEPGKTAVINASSNNQVIDVGTSESLAQVTGKVAMADGGRLPPGLTMALSSTSGVEEIGRVDADGSFRIEGVRPGTYELNARAADAAVAPARMTASGASTEGHLLKIGTAPVTLAATLVESSGSVEGFARRNGKPAPGVMVLLVPANPGANREMFRRDQSDSDGSFSLKRVIPGQYTLVAIEDGWTLDWAHPEVIGHYLPQGQRVTVPSHSHDINIKDAVEVQAK